MAASPRKPPAKRRKDAAPASPMFAYVGCFTTPKRNAHGDGIHAYSVDPASGAWSEVQHVGDLVNPSWFHVNPAETILYVGHGDESYLSTYAIDRQSGRLAALGRVESGGLNTVRVALDPSGRWLLAANYSSGGVAVLPVGAAGTLAPPVQVYALPGKPRPRHRNRQQESSHPHDIVFDPSGRFVVVPDKGLDRVFVFRFDAKAGRISPAGEGFVDARDGSGPRHAAFHPRLPILWVLNELDSTLTVYRWDGRTGGLAPLDVLSTLPGTYAGDTSTSEIAFDALTGTLYVSNRGHDSLTMFRVNPRTGMPKPMGWEPTRGEKPRFFAFHPATRLLYAANEEGNSVIPFRVHAKSGRLSLLRHKIETFSPVTIAFVGGPKPAPSKARRRR